MKLIYFQAENENEKKYTDSYGLKSLRFNIHNDYEYESMGGG